MSMRIAARFRDKLWEHFEEFESEQYSGHQVQGIIKLLWSLFSAEHKEQLKTEVHSIKAMKGDDKP